MRLSKHVGESLCSIDICYAASLHHHRHHISSSNRRHQKRGKKEKHHTSPHKAWQEIKRKVNLYSDVKMMKGGDDVKGHLSWMLLLVWFFLLSILTSKKEVTHYKSVYWYRCAYIVAICICIFCSKVACVYIDQLYTQKSLMMMRMMIDSHVIVDHHHLSPFFLFFYNLFPYPFFFAFWITW